MLVYGYSDYNGVLHIFDTYDDAFNAWANDGNAGVSATPAEEGIRIDDHRVSPMPTRQSAAPTPGSFAHFVSLGQ